jgi:hypothetical protein
VEVLVELLRGAEPLIAVRAVEEQRLFPAHGLSPFRRVQAAIPMSLYPFFASPTTSPIARLRWVG